MTLTDAIELGDRVTLHLDDEARGMGSTFALAIAGRHVDSGEHPIPDIPIPPTPITPRRYERLDAVLHWLATGLRHHPAHRRRPTPYQIPGPPPSQPPILAPAHPHP